MLQPRLETKRDVRSGACCWQELTAAVSEAKSKLSQAGEAISGGDRGGDAGPVVEIKQARQTMRREIQEMDVRVGFLLTQIAHHAGDDPPQPVGD